LNFGGPAKGFQECDGASTTRCTLIKKLRPQVKKMMPGNRPRREKEQRKHMYKTYRNRREMAEAGWQFAAQPEIVQCRDCDSQIEWARSPRGKNVPVNANSCTVHFSTCGQSAPQNSPAPARPPAPPPPPAAPAAPAALVEALRDHTAAIRELSSVIRQIPRRQQPATPPDEPWDTSQYEQFAPSASEIFKPGGSR
jgi:hypothetical protein